MWDAGEKLILDDDQEVIFKRKQSGKLLVIVCGKRNQYMYGMLIKPTRVAGRVFTSETEKAYRQKIILKGTI